MWEHHDNVSTMFRFLGILFDMELQVPGSLSESNAKLQLHPSHFQYSDHHWYCDGTLVI